MHNGHYFRKINTLLFIRTHGRGRAKPSYASVIVTRGQWQRTNHLQHCDSHSTLPQVVSTTANKHYILHSMHKQNENLNTNTVCHVDMFIIKAKDHYKTTDAKMLCH